MSEKSIQESKIKKEIKTILTEFTDLLKSLDSYANSEINSKLWQIRADAELVCVQIKDLIDNENAVLKIQHKVSETVKGTSKRDKAITLLNHLNIAPNRIEAMNIKDEKDIFKIIWELKETISAVLSAFPQKSFIWKNGDFEEEDEDVLII